MKRFLIIFILFCSSSLFAQTSEKYNSEYENYYRAEDLYIKEQYGSARKEFRIFINGFHHPNDPMYVKAMYYEAISALELYNNDAIRLLENFIQNYPESIYKNDIYFRIGKNFYYKKKFKDALVWWSKLSPQEVEKENRDEFYFKVGYANFKLKKYDIARDAFYEVKDGDSQYSAPSMYYFSHIAYQKEKYQVALEGFLKLENDDKFGKVVPYYITQIYYLQGKYEQVTEYASKIDGKGSIVNEKDMNHLIGDAFYRTAKYTEAVPYLEKYNKAKQTTREEDYRLGYAYFKSGDYSKAIKLFDRVKKVKDSLGQVAFYHIGESMLQQSNLMSARSAFEGAAFIDKDPKIQEDALYNYAILSYKLDVNPYDEAVEAFEMYLNKYPNSERKENVFQYLVNVYMKTNNYPKALASLDKIEKKDIRLKTAYQIIAFNQGVDHFQKSKFTAAIKSFELVDKYPIDPEISSKAVFWKADANYRLANYDDAILGFHEFSSLPAQDKILKSEANYNIGYAHLRKEEWNKSTEAFRLYIQDNPENKHKKADALLRVADNYFVQKENDQAIKYYQQVVNQQAGFEDQALFYMAKTYGFNGNTSKKIKKLLEITKKYRKSKYLQLSIYEIAESYLSEGELDKAMEYYKKIIFEYPSSQLVVEAKMSVADIYFKKGNYTKAEDDYKVILKKHSADLKVCERSVLGIIDVYKASQQLEKIDDVLAQYSCVNISSDEKEGLYYLPAVEAYNDSAYQKAITLFDKYLSKFPNGKYSSDVKIFRANCFYKTADIPKAVKLYREILEGPINGYTELMASRVAHYLYTEGNFEEVVEYYKILEQVSSTPAVIFNAKIGLMRSYFLTENWMNSALYADRVLENKELSGNLKLEANYAKGMANYYINNYDAAKVSLVWVFENTTTVKAAETRYALADIFYQQDYLDHADDEIKAILKQKPAYNFWIAKGLILRTKILVKQDDLFEAEQNLKSVLDHYPVPDDGILDEANQLWDELMQLKNQPKEVDPEEENIIEINDQN